MTEYDLRTNENVKHDGDITTLPWITAKIMVRIGRRIRWDQRAFASTGDSNKSKEL